MKINQLVIGFVLALTATAQAQEQAPLMKASRALPAGAFEGTREPQKLQILSSGLASLEKRLELLESAKNSIDMEFYIYNPDLSGRIITQALIKKAKEGVKVRLLVDATPLWRGLDQYYAYVMGLHGIEVRFFNKSSKIKISKANYRSHRKLILIDGHSAITGGRNIADEYFSVSYKYNFIDRDIFIEGSLVSQISKSFEIFWNSDLTMSYPQHLAAPKDSEYGISAKDVESGFYWTDTDQQNYDKYKRDLAQYLLGLERANIFAAPLSEKEARFVEEIRQKGRKALASEYQGICRETYFLGDLAGRSKDSRVVFNGLKSFLKNAKENVTIESPYLVLSQDILSMVQELRNRNIGVQMMTNSLASTDNPAVAAIFYPYIKSLVQSGVKLFLHEGKAPKFMETVTDGAKYARWGTHAKSLTIDADSETENVGMIGSFNFDPRSAHINAELAILCKGNKEFTHALQSDLEKHKTSMVLINEDGKPVDGQSKYFDASAGRVLLFHLAKPLVHLFENWL